MKKVKKVFLAIAIGIIMCAVVYPIVQWRVKRASYVEKCEPNHFGGYHRAADGLDRVHCSDSNGSRYSIFVVTDE